MAHNLLNECLGLGSSGFSENRVSIGGPFFEASVVFVFLCILRFRPGEMERQKMRTSPQKHRVVGKTQNQVSKESIAQGFDNHP